MSNTLFARAASRSDGPSSPKPSPDIEWLQNSVKRARNVGKFAEFHDLTPDIASLLLENNQDNRPLVRSKVEEWRAALRAGDWEENGETIKVADTGELNDGQHRCIAVKETGISMPILFVFGLPRQTRTTVDRGTKRTIGHILGMQGIENGKSVAAAMRFYLILERNVSFETSFSEKEIERALLAHPDICSNVNVPYAAAAKYRLPRGMLTALYYKFSQNHPAKADEFFHMFGKGFAPHENHPIVRLSNRLSENASNKAKLPKVEIAALIIKAMQAFVDGRDITSLRWNPKPSKKNGKTVSGEAFPKVP